MNTHMIQAVNQADIIRESQCLNIYQPINIFDTCTAMDIAVRFVNVSFEGMYKRNDNGRLPTILLSNLRPFPRRVFTCAHELGHHVFGHGSKVDVNSYMSELTTDDAEERLVNIFAGSLLMPIAGIEVEFAKRKWKMENSLPTQFYCVASIFGVGFRSLITHCFANRLISEAKLKALSKFTPSKILKDLLGEETEKSYFKIIDGLSKLPTIDLEVSNYIVLPKNIRVEGDHLREFRDNEIHNTYKAVKPGIVRIYSSDELFTSFIRIQNENYFGLAEYRHLEQNEENE